MSKRDIAALAFTLAGLYAIIEGINAVSAVVYFIWSIFSNVNVSSGMHHDIRSVWIIGLPFALLAVLGCVLIFGSRHFAARLFPDIETVQTPEQRFLAIPALAYSIVGIFLIASGVSGLTNLFGQIAFAGRLEIGRALLYSLTYLVKLAIGLALFFGSHGLVRLWSRLRYAGLRRKMGLCEKCGYDLTGNVSGICPECGQQTDPYGTPQS